jgi:hypothetical protein
MPDFLGIISISQCKGLSSITFRFISGILIFPFGKCIIEIPAKGFFGKIIGIELHGFEEKLKALISSFRQYGLCAWVWRTIQWSVLVRSIW